MRSRAIPLAILTSWCLTTGALGQGPLSQGEIQKILQEVTNRPRNTWLRAGTIQATHKEFGAAKTTNQTTVQNEINKAIQEYNGNPNKKEKTPGLQKMALDAIPFNVRYRLSNESAMTSHVTVRCDNGRFYWEINADSRQDSLKPDASLTGNFMTREFKMSWNKRRIFAWDGQKYTTYTASANRAVVDTAGRLQRAVNGPLTAGLIPWGYGRFTLAELTAARASGQRNASGTIDLTLQYDDGVSLDMTLDPAKAYAVTKATLTTPAGLTTTYTCSSYQSFGGNWVPTTITVDRANRDLQNMLPSSEQWTFTSVSAATPAAGSFTVPLAANAAIEYASPVSAATALYVQSDAANTEELLAEHLTYTAAQGSRRQNCATAAVQYLAAQFGKSVSRSALEGLVRADGGTNLYDLKRLAQSQGLYCRAVKTDLAGLQNLGGAKAILHIPGKNHFVALQGMDERDVWLVDLSSRKFFYRRSVDFFPMDWPDGTALLVSSQPISGSFTELSDTQLLDFVGGSGWACNQLLQESCVLYCDTDLLGCSGSVSVYFERWGCGPAQSGSCEDDLMESGMDTTCIIDNYYDCTVTGEWFYYYMSACG
jgi:hypothetical protein